MNTNTISADISADAASLLRCHREQISADAHYLAEWSGKDTSRIIKHLWAIAVLLPIACAIIINIAK
jgi:hypothetical protein